MHFSLSLILFSQVKIWFQNRRTKWKKMEGISNAEAAEHKIGGPKHIDTIRQKQNSEPTGTVQGTVAEKTAPLEEKMVTVVRDDDGDDDDDEEGCDSPCNEMDVEAVVPTSSPESDIEMVGRYDNRDRVSGQEMARGHGRLTDNDSVMAAAPHPFLGQTQVTEIPDDSADDADAKVMNHVILRDEENGEREKSKWENHTHNAETILADHLHQCH